MSDILLPILLPCANGEHVDGQLVVSYNALSTH